MRRYSDYHCGAGPTFLFHLKGVPLPSPCKLALSPFMKQLSTRRKFLVLCEERPGGGGRRRKSQKTRPLAVLRAHGGMGAERTMGSQGVMLRPQIQCRAGVRGTGGEEHLGWGAPGHCSPTGGGPG